MILGIGTDISSIARIEKVLEKHGARFTARCFSETERQKAEAAASPFFRAAAYAKRWAAKEACAKALGLGIRDGIYLKDITVVSSPSGAPQLRLFGGAKERLTALTPHGMTAQAHISITDDGAMALAFVVLSTEPEQ